MKYVFLQNNLKQIVFFDIADRKHTTQLTAQ